VKSSACVKKHVLTASDMVVFGGPGRILTNRMRCDPSCEHVDKTRGQTESSVKVSAAGHSQSRTLSSNAVVVSDATRSSFCVSSSSLLSC
jgi:hypothetical protein